MVSEYLLNLQSRIQQVKDSLPILVGSCISENVEVSDGLADLNREQLYELGQDAKKVNLAPYRSKYYADMKAEMRGGKELTDLFLTGEFQRNLYIYVEGENYGLTSSDEKTGKLIEKYGENIFGLSDDIKPTKTFPILKESLQIKVMEGLKHGLR